MPGRYIAVGLYSGVAVKRGSTVLGAMHSVIMRLDYKDSLESVDLIGQNRC